MRSHHYCLIYEDFNLNSGDVILGCMISFLGKKGFTLPEFLIIVSILLVMGGIIIYGTGLVQARERDAERQQFMKLLAVTLEQYRGGNKHYPIAGDPIPGGSVVSNNSSFNSMMTALIFGNFIDGKKAVDPGLGKLFGDFNGSDQLMEGLKFEIVDGSCAGNQVKLLKSTENQVSYGYYSINGQGYIMCLTLENGEKKEYGSPKDL